MNVRPLCGFDQNAGTIAPPYFFSMNSFISFDWSAFSSATISGRFSSPSRTATMFEYGEVLSSMKSESFVGFRLACIAKFVLMTAMVTSSRARGSCAASISLNWRFFLFSLRSCTVALTPRPSFSLMMPAFSKSSSARPPLVGSFGMAMTSPSFSSSSFLTFFE